MEYTEQEIEMLARFLWASRATMTAWDALYEPEREHMRRAVKSGQDEVANAAARLMREAREQGLAMARDEIRKAGEREEATWEQLVRDVKEARERGATEMLNKALALTGTLADKCIAAMKKNAQSPDMVSNAFDEGGYVMATNIACALKELATTDGSSEYERDAAERAKYRADDVVLARSPLAASCVRQGVTAQAAANAFEYELHDLTQEFVRYKMVCGMPAVIRVEPSADELSKAREQGAAEMRERAARIARDNGADVLDVDRLIRALPLTPTTDDAKASKLARLRRELSDAGDRRDRYECDRIDAEIEAVERSGQ